MWVSLAAVAILLATASSNSLRRPGCRRGSIMKRDCNTCVCDQGGNWACTAIICPRTKRDISCSSEEMEDPLMKCACVEKGFGSAEDKAQCLREKAAGELQMERENRTTAVEQVCAPGTTFMKDCNTCQCNNQGTTAVCTLKKCHEGLQPERVKRSNDGRWVCEPGLTFMKDCNQCQCNKDGTDMVCTMKRCYPVCRPGKLVFKSCNICICIGNEWKCTSNKCPPAKPLNLCPKNEYDEEDEEEDERFKRDVRTQTSMQPAVCLKPKQRLKDCNTCRPRPSTHRPIEAGPTTTTTARPLQPVCLPPKDTSKNCNSCTFHSKGRRPSSGLQQHISSPYHSSHSDKALLPIWPIAPSPISPPPYLLPSISHPSGSEQTRHSTPEPPSLLPPFSIFNTLPYYPPPTTKSPDLYR